MMKTFRKLVKDIKNTHEYKVERVKLEFVRSLSRLMKLRSINSSELASRVDTSNAYISKALRGDTNFTIDSMVKLSNAVGGQLHIHIADSSASVRWLEVISSLPRSMVQEAVDSPVVRGLQEFSESEFIDVNKFYSECNNEERRVFA